MMNKKLWAFSLSISRTRLRFSSIFFPESKVSTTFYCSSFRAVRQYRVSTNSEGQFSTDYWFSRTNFCSLSSAIVNRCWSCNAVTASKPFLACESCKSVQPVDTTVDYFQIFDMDKIYGIDDTHLERKYKNWQKKLHPDLVHTKSEKEREYAAEQSARVIDAYRTLQKPLLRAIYLLRLEGVHVDEEKTMSEPELLVEMMEFREAVEEADSPETLKQIRSQVQAKLDIWSKSFEDAFKNRNFEEAISSIQRMTYYHRINEEIEKKLLTRLTGITSLTIRIDLPGFNKNEVKVEVAHEKVLQISGERKKEVEEKNDGVERSHGKFVRRFRLPEG